jgi:maltose O-acetyltransferase
MISIRKIYEMILQKIISLEAAISIPATPSKLRMLCLKAMGVKTSGHVWVAKNTWICNPEFLNLGNRVCIGEDSQVVCYAPVTIGDDFLSSSGLYINSGSHDVTTLMPILLPITIGDRVWCGMRVTICAGVTIGDDVVIGAGSVVTKSLPSGCVAYGVPAKPVRQIDRSQVEEFSRAFCQAPLRERVYWKLNTWMKNNIEQH